jgi:drug/metabolite transporter (DMT)-like permease
VTPGAPPARLRVAAAFAAVYVIWGSTYLAIRYAVETLPPALMTGVRFVIAGAMLYGWARLRGAEHPTRPEWLAASVVGCLLLLGGTVSVGWAEQHVASGIASLIVAMTPLWMVLMEWAGPGGRPPTARVMAGIFVGIVGLALLIGPDLLAERGSVDVVSVAVLLLGSLAWAAGSLYSRRAALPASAMLGMGMEMLAGGALCIAAGLLVGEASRLELSAVSSRSAVALAYLVLFGSLLGFTSYLWLLRVSTPARVATHAYVNPVVAVLLGWGFAGEPLTVRTLAAAAVIVTAVALIIARQAGSWAGGPERRAAPAKSPWQRRREPANTFRERASSGA